MTLAQKLISVWVHMLSAREQREREQLALAGLHGSDSEIFKTIERMPKTGRPGKQTKKLYHSARVATLTRSAIEQLETIRTAALTFEQAQAICGLVETISVLSHNKDAPLAEIGKLQVLAGQRTRKNGPSSKHLFWLKRDKDLAIDRPHLNKHARAKLIATETGADQKTINNRLAQLRK